MAVFGGILYFSDFVAEEKMAFFILQFSFLINNNLKNRTPRYISLRGRRITLI